MKIKSFIKESLIKFKDIFLKWLKIFGKSLLKILTIISLLMFIIIPFLHNSIDHRWAQWLWYPSCAVTFFLTIIDYIKNKDPICKTPQIEFLRKLGDIWLFPVFVSIFVFNYYEIDNIWLWVIFVVIAILVPTSFFAFFFFEKTQNQYTQEEKNRSCLNIIKYILLYWLYDLFYMAIFNQWLVWIYIFGIAALVIVFYNLAKTFLRGAKSLQLLLIFDFLFGVGLSVYLIYIIPSNSLQEIVLTIAAAVYGGLFTLLGVAWTIKQSYEKGQEDDKKKNVPYLSKGTDPNSSVKITIIKNGNYYLDLQLLNDAIFIFKGAFLDGEFVPEEKLVPPKSFFTVVLNTHPYEEISFVGCDILGNSYRFDLSINEESKIVESISLPIEIDSYENIK